MVARARACEGNCSICGFTYSKVQSVFTIGRCESFSDVLAYPRLSANTKNARLAEQHKHEERISSDVVRDVRAAQLLLIRTTTMTVVLVELFDNCYSSFHMDI